MKTLSITDDRFGWARDYRRQVAQVQRELGSDRVPDSDRTRASQARALSDYAAHYGQLIRESVTELRGAICEGRASHLRGKVCVLRALRVSAATRAAARA